MVTRHRAALTGLIGLMLAGAHLYAASIHGANGLTVSLTAAGAYEITTSAPAWKFNGSVLRPVTGVAISSGADSVGAFEQIDFDFVWDAPRHASIRSYLHARTLLFTMTQGAAGGNTLPFPRFTQYPKNLHRLNFSGTFAYPTFFGTSEESPWMCFDDAGNSFMLSAASNFMVASTRIPPTGELTSGISPQIATLPGGFTHRVLLTMETGINRGFETWGQTLTALQGKKRPANDTGAILERIGYWTDAGAAYYYGTEPGMTYPQTLAAIKADFDRAGIGLGYMQLDSWFYPKGPRADWNDSLGGIFEYFPSVNLFPSTLNRFQQSLGVPLITHARWIDGASPYRGRYRMSGNVSIDPSYWQDIAHYLASSGVSVYEQDWLWDWAKTDFNLTDGAAFLDNMADAMQREGIAVQYCTGDAHHFMQAAKYGNLTTIRTSEDRFERGKWTNFLFASRLATALGVWPFSDVFMSSETGNLLLSTLSAGPVGIGDVIGKMDATNVRRAVRADGVIVKPDAAILPVDTSYLEQARIENLPIVSSTYADFGGMRAVYLFLHSQGGPKATHYRLADLGMSGPAYLYDYFAGTGRLLDASETVFENVDDWLYRVAVPVGRSGIAMIGDAEHFVGLGKKRVAEFSDDGTVQMKVLFAPAETARTITGYAPSAPIPSGGEMAGYDPVTGRFRIRVTPGEDRTATVRLWLSPVRPLREKR